MYILLLCLVESNITVTMLYHYIYISYPCIHTCIAKVVKQGHPLGTYKSDIIEFLSFCRVLIVFKIFKAVGIRN